MKSFKEYLNNKTDITKYTTDIAYGYKVSLNLYKNDSDKILRVNPTTVLDTIGMGTSGISDLYSGMLTNYDVFF